MKRKSIIAVLLLGIAGLLTSCGSDDETILVKSITLSQVTATIEVGESAKLTVKVIPSDAEIPAVTWTSSNEAVAKVTSKGVVSGVAEGTASINATAKDGSGVTASCLVTVTAATRGTTGGHDWVQIGGVKWATMNVGATTVAGSDKTSYGDFFTWGETTPRYSSMVLTEKYNTTDATFTWKSSWANISYTSPSDFTGTKLDAVHDAATANWGSRWRTPTKEEFMALVEACTGSSANDQAVKTVIYEKVTEPGIYWLQKVQTGEPAYTGVGGILFVSKANTARRVFFPLSGEIGAWYDNGDRCGYYLSSSRNTSNTNEVYVLFLFGEVSPARTEYYTGGFSVRPVLD